MKAIVNILLFLLLLCPEISAQKKAYEQAFFTLKEMLDGQTGFRFQKSRFHD